MTHAHDSTQENPARANSAVMCAPFQTGYELHPIQQRAALATRSLWRDAIVSTVAADGWIDILDLATDAVARVWHYADLTETVAPGEPVTLNARYGVLAIGHTFFSVRTS
jgi:hypothetical protein